MRLLLTLVVAVMLSGCAGLKDPREYPGFTYLDTFKLDGESGKDVQHGSTWDVYHAYYKPGQGQYVDEIAVRDFRYLNGNVGWDCSGQSRVLLNQNEIFKFDSSNQFKKTLKSILVSKAGTLRQEYCSRVEIESCVTQTAIGLIQLKNSDILMANACKDWWEELIVDELGNTITAQYMNISLTRGFDYYSALPQYYEYKRNGLNLHEKIIMYLDQKKTPTKAISMVLRKGVDGLIPEDFGVEDDVFQEDRQLIQGREFVRRVKVYRTDSAIAKLLLRYNVEMPGDAIAIEYSAYMDGSKTSQVVLGFYKVVGEEPADRLSDGEATSRDLTLITGLESDAKKMLGLD